jgi:hypothetical protein
LYPGQSGVGEGRIFGIDDGLNADIAGLGGKHGADAQGQIVHASVVFAEVRKLVSESRFVRLESGLSGFCPFEPDGSQQQGKKTPHRTIIAE